MIAVVVSRADSASEHVGEHLLELGDWTARVDDGRPEGEGGGTVYRTDGFELRSFDDLHLDLDGVADAFDDPEFVVFASRHSGDTGPLLTAHFTGNFGEAEYGGADRDLAEPCPNALAAVLDALVEYAPEGYEVGMEATHHGPSSVGAPSTFVEVGSDEQQWDDPAAARAVARAILELRGVDPHRREGANAEGRGGTTATRGPDAYRHLAWFGGGHYAPRPTRVVRETDWAVGHVAADWGLDAMGDPAEHEDVVAAAFEESRAERAVVQDDRPGLAATIEELGHRVVSETWVRETDGVPVLLVEALEAALCPVDEGLRFGSVATGDGAAGDPTADPEFVVVDLPEGLLDEARGVDQAATRAAVADAALAFETAEAGNQVVGRAALPDADDRDAVVDGLVAVLRERYDAVEREDGAVVARESAFDPERARELGVPEGPKFGRLADGEAVTVGGREVQPEAVHAERTRRFPL